MEQVAAFWNETATPVPVFPAPAQDLSCDVAIVGGGFTGLRAALMLAEAGASVALFEGRDIANGASGRSGGQVNPMLPVARPEDLRRAVGSRYFERLAEVALKSADDLFDLVKHHRIDCEARQKGWLRADHCVSAREVARENAKLWNRMGAEFDFVDAAEVRRLTSAHGYVSGTVSPRGGAVQPLSLARGLARAAADAGARLFSEAPVRGLAPGPKGWVLKVNDITVQAEQVIVATNGYTDALVSGLKRSILPLTSIQIATEPLDAERLAPLCPEGHTISDTRRLIMYCRREPGGQFIYGGIGFRRPAGGVGGWRWLYCDAERIFPGLRGVRWTHRWGGAIALTPDRVPHLHEPQRGLIAGLGYNGRGVAMSLVMGRELARRALGTPAEDLPFPLSPVRPYRFREPQVLGAGVAMAWLRLLDKREFNRAGRGEA
jgi:sarcosine oxidase